MATSIACEPSPAARSLKRFRVMGEWAPTPVNGDFAGERFLVCMADSVEADSEIAYIVLREYYRDVLDIGYIWLDEFIPTSKGGLVGYWRACGDKYTFGGGNRCPLRRAKASVSASIQHYIHRQVNANRPTASPPTKIALPSASPAPISPPKVECN